MAEKKKVILISDDNVILLNHLEKLFHNHPKYHAILCSNGTEVLHHLERSSPELCILDLILPQIHGIELLKLIKANTVNNKIGVIISSWEPMVQNYRAACVYGADYFLDKPFTDERLLKLIDEYFLHGLMPDTFPSLFDHQDTKLPYFEIKSEESNSYIKFWGTRGSCPVSGESFIRFGGCTSCLEIRSNDTLVIIDAGTGIRELGSYLLKEGKHKHFEIIISHTHLDHIGGFPFFAPLFHKDCSICLRAPIGYYKSTKDLFSDMLTHAFFPIDLHEVQAELSFKEVRTNEPLHFGNITIESHHTFHPGSTVGFKIRIGNTCFGYITDNEVFLGYQGDPNLIKTGDSSLEPYLSLIDFLKECDFIVHEAQYTAEGYGRKIGWGHSSINNATALIKQIDTKLWIVTHHDPNDTDMMIQKKHQIHTDTLKYCGINCQVRMAYDGLKIYF